MRYATFTLFLVIGLLLSIAVTLQPARAAKWQGWSSYCSYHPAWAKHHPAVCPRR